MLLGRVEPAMASLVQRNEVSFSPEAVSLFVAKGTEACMRTLEHTRSTELNGDGKPWVFCQERADLALRIYQSEAAEGGEGSNLLRHLGVCTVSNISPSVLLEFMMNIPHRLTWDRNLAGMEVVPVLDETISLPSSPSSVVVRHRRCYISRSLTKRIGPISARDFVDSSMVLSLDGWDGELDGGAKSESSSILACGAGLSPSETFGLFPVTDVAVRGNNQPSGWHLHRCGTDGRDCKVYFVIHTDLKGWFAPMIINKVIGGSFVTFFQDLKTALAARRA